MADWKLEIYYRLPPALRNIAASWHGYQLKRWRYGLRSDELVQEALERDRWSTEKWKIYQENKIEYILHRAATQIPYYRKYWSARRMKGDSSSWRYLENWPILNKEELRKNPQAFLADDCDPTKMYVEHTSGTTGTPIYLYTSKSTQEKWFALFEARNRQWNNTNRHENWAILGGQAIIPPNASKPPFWVWNAPMNQLYLSANHLSESRIAAYVNAISKYEITHMIVYTSSAAYLAREILLQNIQVPDSLKVILTNAEPLFPWQKSVTEQAFHCPVRETYGMGEYVAAASADDNDHLRQWPEVGYIEVLSDTGNFITDTNVSGELICTGLLNKDMPLIRYRVGDRVRKNHNYPSSNSTIKLPYFGKIEGRSNDLLIGPDGRRVFWINPIFYGLPILESQVIQEKPDTIRVLIVPDKDFDVETQELIKQRLIERVGSVKILMEQLEEIPREANGKFRPVINRATTSQNMIGDT